MTDNKSPIDNHDEDIFKDFRDLPFQVREAALKTELVKMEMLEKLPTPIAEIFIDGFLYPSLEKHEVLKEFFALPDTSEVTNHTINHKPSSHKAFEPLYNKKPVKLVDQYFYNCPAGDAIPDRLDAVVQHLPDWIKRSSAKNHEIKVLVPGSGPAQDIIRILKNNRDLRERMVAYCIDNEPSALELGRKLAYAAGVLENIYYIEGDLMKLDYENFDIVLLVGIICPLSNIKSYKVLTKVSSYLKRDGYIVVSAPLQKMLIEDPVTCFVMDFIDCKLHYKTSADIDWILQKSKLEILGAFQDPKRHYHLIFIARKNGF